MSGDQLSAAARSLIEHAAIGDAVVERATAIACGEIQPEHLAVALVIESARLTSSLVLEVA